KCFGRHSKATFSGSLNSQRWRFLKNGLDDFRSGVPAPSDNIIIRGPKGPLPIVLPNNAPDASCGAQQKAGKIFARQFRLSPLQKARQDHIAKTEYCLSQHPLVLYPHLKESISPELFEEVVAILDPEIKCRISWRTGQDDSTGSCEPSMPLKHSSCSVYRGVGTVPTLLTGSSKGSPWGYEEEVMKPHLELLLTLPCPRPLRENHGGGESYNIEEDTIMRLFDAGYVTKPTLAKTVEVVEINNVPLELKQCLEFSLSPKVLFLLGFHREFSVPTGLYQPKWEKFRYGAWYLDPKTWRKLKANEPLEDPKVAGRGEAEDTEKQPSSEETDAVQLHGTHAFNEFLEKKGYRKP
uniref:Uncharacterized protein n=1 Tax=Pelodiscus sinensis TaxID=13735 RepID=K7FQ51_PELSI